MISKKYYRYIHSLFMALFMTTFMSGILSYINLGLVDGFLKIWISGQIKAFVVAYPTILIISPFVARMANKICSKD
ncbi:DUF2798 domain-containing protein [Campylobacter pinnipediorum]|uniref:DUF2798 domain-containing protein n=1 Tax=Campylobacter pinnipediorum subsp. pinnipediorum TaxID=1660067 RepID=A0AAX0L8V8_9BACT|nr:DUF2798 domain-containing protein [Campylobacter pinnipediorum]AQW81943.1 hypothetical membrane protein (DUF2798 domain) [Campylobacter pinnipediorum subsp. pinnipediorum]AQW83614.1 hypothetical membrane protein (DUF2798 domain) [Campylobacter pinnipediorum subsp. pinnipediorum]AQW85136.1 hypothetical membrane protein (DUF2798 domain) [Campylobacter pinnipediorum subsp. pinnipediorum]OPA75894.1 hypothetical protein BFG04_05495 [Campylobacter pinnipediorum subsp. pinnipediorum]OPA75995.1 hyp